MTESQTTQLMTWATEYKALIDSGGSFLVEQSPLVVQEMLFRPWLNFGVASFLLLLFMFVAWFLVVKAGNAADEFLIGVGAGVLLLLSGFFAATFYSVLSAHFTPRLYIMEQLAGMVM